MCDPILVTLPKMQPHSSQSSRENATPSSGTSPLASYKGVPSPGTAEAQKLTTLDIANCRNISEEAIFNAKYKLQSLRSVNITTTVSLVS